MEETQQVQNQNPITSTPPIATYPTPQPTPTSKTPFVLIVLLVFLLGTASYFGYQTYQLKQLINEQQPRSTPPTIVSSPSPSSTTVETTLSPTPNITASWKTYSDPTYTFKYPPTWTVKPGTAEAEQGYWEGKDFVEIISPTPTVTISIAPAQPPYGFAGVEHKQGETFNITINGTVYIGKEDIRVESGKTKIFVDMPVDANGNEYHVLFGTGYPVNQDEASSQSDYLKYRDTIIQILSTLKILK